MLALLLTALLALQDKTLTFTGPDKAKPEDLKKAAAALEARCKGFGYEGITCAVKKDKTGSFVTLTSLLPITREVSHRINILARHKATSLRVVFQMVMRGNQSDQYPSPFGRKPQKMPAAPPGTFWLPIESFYGSPAAPNDSPTWIAVWKDRELTQDDFTVEYIDGKGLSAWLVLTEKGKAKLAKFPQDVTKAGDYRLLCDNAVDFPIHNFAEWLRPEPQAIHLSFGIESPEGASFRYPMPFPLTIK